jgi:mono/diheme cytochrome c family protein
VRNELTLANSSLEKTGAKRRTTPLTFCLLPLTLGVLVSAGCRQDMHDAPRYDPYESSAIFRNESSAQPLVAGTEPRTEVAGAVLDEDELLNTGKQAGQLANVFPFAITRADIDRGEERFNIYCAPCHGRTGEGNGMVVQRGYRQAANFHVDRLRMMPVGYYIDVMTNGFGVMPDYRAQVTVDDRWRIAAYVKALQLSHSGAAGDVPAAELERLKSGKAAEPAAAHKGEK